MAFLSMMGGAFWTGTMVSFQPLLTRIPLAPMPRMLPACRLPTARRNQSLASAFAALLKARIPPPNVLCPSIRPFGSDSLIPPLAGPALARVPHPHLVRVGQFPVKAQLQPTAGLRLTLRSEL